MCAADSLKELLLRLSVSKAGELKPFEAVLRQSGPRCTCEDGLGGIEDRNS
jgi:hypothetical protein